MYLLALELLLNCPNQFKIDDPLGRDPMCAFHMFVS